MSRRCPSCTAESPRGVANGASFIKINSLAREATRRLKDLSRLQHYQTQSSDTSSLERAGALQLGNDALQPPSSRHLGIEQSRSALDEHALRVDEVYCKFLGGERAERERLFDLFFDVMEKRQYANPRTEQHDLTVSTDELLERTPLPAWRARTMMRFCNARRLVAPDRNRMGRMPAANDAVGPAK